MSGGGSQTSTSQTTVPPQFLNAYTDTVNRATNVANTPYQGYSGNLVAGFSPQQTQAQGEVGALQGSYNPLLGQAANAVGASTANLWNGVAPVNAQTIGQYESPYQSQVVGATEGQIANTDAQQFNQLSGQAGAAGAFGGDRMGVAQGVLGGQQALANNSTLAGLNQSNYTQALQTAEQQQGAQLGANEANAWLDSQAGYAYGNLANEGNQLGLTDASALAQSGLTQQQQQQAGLNTAYEQWQAQQAFPYQQTGWLANITEGIGSNVGGTSTTTQTNNAAGGRVPRASGGIVPPGYDGGGGISILGDTPDPANSYIPGASGSGGGGSGIGRGPPPAPSIQNQPGMFSNPAADVGAASGAVGLYNNLGLGGAGALTDLTANGAIPAGISQLGDVALGSDLTMPATSVLGASPGFLGGLGSAVDAGSAGLGSAATGIASGIGDVASGIGSGLAAAGSGVLDFIGSLLAFLHTGGRVGNDNEPQHHAAGGNVVPLRPAMARGGMPGNQGEMPYDMAPPVPVQATGTYGSPGISPPMQGYMGGISPTALASPPSAPASGASVAGAAPAMWLTPSGQGINTNPFGAAGMPNPAALRRGGRAGYADAGTVGAIDDDPWGGSDTGTIDPAASSPGIAPTQTQSVPLSAGSYTPQTPNLWLPALAAVATSALGRHHEAGHNIAEGVLAGLGTYGQENAQYQQQRENQPKVQSEQIQAQQAQDNLNALRQMRSNWGTAPAGVAPSAGATSSGASPGVGGVAPGASQSAAPSVSPGVAPVANPADLERQALAYINSGVPQLVASGKETLTYLHNISTQSTQFASDGSLVPIAGAQDAAAGMAAAKAKATFPYDATKELLSRAGQPVAVKPNETVTTGFNVLNSGNGSGLNDLLGRVSEAQNHVKTQAANSPSGGRLPPAQEDYGNTPDPLLGGVTSNAINAGAAPAGGYATNPAAQPFRAASGQPGQAAQPRPSFQPSAPPAADIPVVTKAPPDLAPSQMLSSPQLVRNPDGSLTSTQNTFSAAAGHAQGEDIGKIPNELTTLGNTRTQLVAIRDEIKQNATSPAFLQQGYGADSRTAIANGINSAAKIAGVGPVFDETSVGNNQAFAKNSNVAAFTLARTMSGGRVALGEVMQANRSVPNLENSYYGNSVVSNLLLQDNLRQTDRLRYQAQQAERGASPTDAGDAFDRVNPPAQYVVSALASAVKDYAPRSVQALAAAPTAANMAAFDKRYGQGTAQTILAGGQ